MSEQTLAVAVVDASTEAVAKSAVPLANPADSAEFLRRFWAMLDVMPATRATYERNMARYVSWLGTHGLTVLDPVAPGNDYLLRDYKEWLLQEHQGSTVQTYLIPVRRFYRWLSSISAALNPAANLKAPRTGKAHSRTALSDEQARRTVAVARECAEDGTLAGLRDCALYLLLLGCGLRTIEAARANVGDLYMDGGRWVLRVQGKGHATKDDVAVLPDVVADAIQSYLQRRQKYARQNDEPMTDDAPLFVSFGNRSRGRRLSTRAISRIAKTILQDAGIDDVRITAHSLRHTAVTSALRHGASEQAAQQLARHRDINTTMRYAHNLKRLSNPAVDAAVAYL